MRKGRRVAGEMKRLGGMPRYGDMVGMPIQPVGAESERRLRTKTAHFQHQPLHHLGGIGVDQRLGVAVGFPARHPRIAVSPNLVAGQPQRLHRARKLHPPDFPQRFPRRRPLLPDFPLLPQRSGKQTHPHPPPGMGRQSPAHRKSLIIRVRKTSQQTVFGHFHLLLFNKISVITKAC